MGRSLLAAILGVLLVQDGGDAAAEKAKLDEELAKAAEPVAEQLLKWKSWDEARAFLEVIRAKSDARAEALEKLLAKTDKQTSGWEWDRRTSELIKQFGKERAKKFYAFARAWKEKDPKLAKWTDTEGEILDDLFDYARAFGLICNFRAQHALPKARFDWKLSVPAVWHAKYIQLYPKDESEVESREGYTAEGKACESNAVSNHGKSLGRLVEDIVRGAFDRVYALNPRLIRIGIGQSGGASISSVVDVESGLEAGESLISVVSPPDKAKDVPLRGVDVYLKLVPGKSMTDLGYPISLIVFDPSAKIRNVKAKISEGNKAAIDNYLSSPEQPALPDEYPNNRNSILIIPAAPLKPNTSYTVAVDYSTRGELKKMSWSFSTGR